MKSILLEGTLELIFSLALVLGAIHFFVPLFKEKSKMLYIATGLVSTLSLLMGVLVFLKILDVPLSLWWVRVIRSIISGYLPASVFIFVMFAGALSGKNRYKVALMSIRTELSLIGTILYLPHALIYNVFSMPRGLVALLSGNFNLFYQLMTWTGLINTVLLIILGITSIPHVRKKMKASKWKKIQSTAYIFYFNCFVHYITLSLYSQAYERTILYLMIYGTYSILLLKRARSRKPTLILETQ